MWLLQVFYLFIYLFFVNYLVANNDEVVVESKMTFLQKGVNIGDKCYFQT
jgi:type IV secretory pathway VirB3-like protein